MLFAQSVMDPWMLSNYQSHDDETLGYMQNAILYQINKLMYSTGSEKKKKKNKGWFNFPTFHVMAHYMYGTLHSINTCHIEAAYKFLIKEDF